MPSAGPPSAVSVINRSHQLAKIPSGTLTAMEEQQDVNPV